MRAIFFIKKEIFQIRKFLSTIWFRKYRNQLKSKNHWSFNFLEMIIVKFWCAVSWLFKIYIWQNLKCIFYLWAYFILLGIPQRYAFYWQHNIFLYVLSSIEPSPVVGHLGCFQFSNVLNNVVTKTSLPIHFCVHVGSILGIITYYKCALVAYCQITF